MAKNVEININNGNNNYEILYPKSVSNNILNSDNINSSFSLENNSLLDSSLVYLKNLIDGLKTKLNNNIASKIVIETGTRTGDGNTSYYIYFSKISTFYFLAQGKINGNDYNDAFWVISESTTPQYFYSSEEASLNKCTIQPGSIRIYTSRSAIGNIQGIQNRANQNYNYFVVGTSNISY